jgi:putative transcriptional regulator
VIRCNLSRLMGEKKIRVTELARLTGLHRSRIDLLYNEKAVRIDVEVLETLCRFFDCEVGDLLELVKE